MKISKNFIVLILFLNVGTLWAQKKWFSSLHINPTLGYQRERLDWSIAGNAEGTSPNVLSELIWKDIALQRVGVSGQAYLYKGLYVKGSYASLKVLNGFANDSDYSRDNRQRNEYDYTQDFRSNKGDGSEYLYALGYDMSVFKRWRVGLQLGRYYKKQVYYLLDFDPPVIQFPQQMTTYTPRWKGWEAKISAAYQYNRWSGSLSQSYQQLDYFAQANWVLRNTFAHPVSFEHTAYANGWRSELSIAYELYPQVKIFGQSQFGWVHTAKGVDHLYRKDGSEAFTRLNGANYQFYNAQIGLSFSLK